MGGVAARRVESPLSADSAASPRVVPPRNKTTASPHRNACFLMFVSPSFRISSRFTDGCSRHPSTIFLRSPNQAGQVGGTVAELPSIGQINLVPVDPGGVVPLYRGRGLGSRQALAK